MRLVFDVFPCQTSSRYRGIGRFTQSLVNAMAQGRGRHDMRVLASALYPESADALRREFRSILPAGHFSTYTSIDRRLFGNDSATAEEVAASLIHRAYEELAPDVVVYGNPFEGWCEKGVVPLPKDGLPSAMRAGILYDLIPWIFRYEYLERVPPYAAWYARRMEALRDFDLLLAISEASRRDAIEILDLPEDRVVNISGAQSRFFHPDSARLFAASHLETFGITRPFVLYTGNGDYRKNQDGLLQAYARLPLALRRAHQLVLNQVGDKTLFRQKVRALGLTDEDVVVTGHITDDELGYLYARCKVFIFPSLYEGFGLPILEAMACGAPVIAANNSSIPEVVGRTDILFDASNSAAIAESLTRVLVDDKLREELAAYGIQRAAQFSWEKSAAAAWNAIETRLEAKSRRMHTTPPATLGTPSIAVVCVPDAAGSGAAGHCTALLPLLARHFEIDVFVEKVAGESAATALPFSVYAHGELSTRYARYATVVYELANRAECAFMLPLLEQLPGLVVMHDAAMNAPVAALAQRHSLQYPLLLESEIIHSHGLQGLLAFSNGTLTPEALDTNRHVLESAVRIVAPVQVAHTLAMQCDGGTWLPPVEALSPDRFGNDVDAYRAAIQSAIEADMRQTIRHLGDALEKANASDAQLDEIAGAAITNTYLRRQPRLLFDVTQLSKTDARSGIQRVVRNIAREIGGMPGTAPPLELVRQSGGKLWRATKAIGAIFGVDPQRIPEQEVFIHPGDTLLMIDSSWEQYADFAPVFQRVRQFGGKIVTVVYDLIPLFLPHTCDAGLVAVFRNWFSMAAKQSDMLLCISRCVADEVAAYLEREGIGSGRALHIDDWPLGADLAVNEQESSIRQQVIDMTSDTQSPLFLMVGTIEPRKGHDFVLDAFETLWAQGEDVHLCIAGGVGWKVESTMQRIRNNPQLDKRLFFVEKFTDAEINRCYVAATALIAGSVAEGYGLPIVEAALHHVPVLASDIPVFREVGGDGAIYFSLDDPEDLPRKVMEMSRMTASTRAQLANRVKTHTWRESATRLLDAISDKTTSGYVRQA